MRISDHIRAHLLEQCGVREFRRLNLDELRISEWSSRFETLMRNRLIMGAFRYGPLHSESKSQWDRIAYAKSKLSEYESSGNLECLVDAANLALLEFEEGNHPLRHWSAQDDKSHCNERKEARAGR